jgi:hypothetical protein
VLLNPRLVRQAGLFTYHPEPNSPLTPTQLPVHLGGKDGLIATRIPTETKIALREVLDFYGINEITLFPDLDGLSRHINWQTRAQVQRRNVRVTQKPAWRTRNVLCGQPEVGRGAFGKCREVRLQLLP